MLKKNIKYTDYDGKERQEDFYFGLNKAELMKMQLSAEGGLDSLVRRIIKTERYSEMYSLMTDIILNSYGVKSDDGKRFIKNPEVRASFEQSPAYEILVMELLQDDKAAAAFITGILPADLASEVSTKLESNNGELLDA